MNTAQSTLGLWLVGILVLLGLMTLGSQCTFTCFHDRVEVIDPKLDPKDFDPRTPRVRVDAVSSATPHVALELGACGRVDTHVSLRHP